MNLPVDPECIPALMDAIESKMRVLTNQIMFGSKPNGSYEKLWNEHRLLKKIRDHIEGHVPQVTGAAVRVPDSDLAGSAAFAGPKHTFGGG